MLLKLALSSIKSRLKDYIVLLLGLVISISIFYMFETLAMNETFIEENSIITAVSFVFQAGSVLLAIITIAYCLYANSFLFSLRQKEFGMYMTLGAKKRKISLLMFIETMFIGIVSMILGLIIGIILSKVIGNVLMNQLDFHSTSYQVFYLPSLIVTVVFFTILFLLSAIANMTKLSRMTALELIHGEAFSDHIVIKKRALLIKGVLSLILLIIGYVCMIQIEKTQNFGIIVALITITSGTYLFFSTFLPFVIQKKREQMTRKSKKINSFTYAQLSFRINQLTRVLATVAMLIALGVGAIAVGFAFKNNSALQLEHVATYDVKIMDPSNEQMKLIDTMDYQEKVTYDIKIVQNNVYFDARQLKAYQPYITQYGNTLQETKKVRLTNKPQMNDQKWDTFLSSLLSDQLTRSDYNIIILPHTKFIDQTGQSHDFILGMTKDFTQNLSTLKKLDQTEIAKHAGEENYYHSSKYTMYTSYNSLASGTVFMGFFLGFAFLTMMASCLMFKILTGAANDARRYQMLEKMGVHRKLLKQSIYKEMFLTFLFPGVIGFVHVALGMMMFNFLLFDPYYKFYIPALLFLVIYTIYYFITVWMYKGIVLKK